MKTWVTAMIAAGSALLLAGAAPAGPDRSLDQALIVGSVEYAEGVAAPLIGAYNDAAITARTLLDRGIPGSGVTVLTQTPSAALIAARGNPKLRDMPALATPIAAPTRAAIMAGFARLARNAKPGSRVVIMLSGHGLQISGRAEADGLDGAYLPSDTGPADAANVPRNAITDDEIAGAVEAIRRKGATVVLLFAFSHSGDVIDDLRFGARDAAVTGMASTPATATDRQYLVPHRDYQAPPFAGSPMIAYLMLELDRWRGMTSIALLSRNIAPWMARHHLPLNIPFGRTDIEAL
ncbi:caspase family protein [Sphingomonas sp.]|uniref:caspase family protein n=1 Tax=Sphingomonas sp. TaxID=28214 RepID=UPI001EC4ED56|nr:caspase family protein [Sphingomonas sp.]MBX3593589.1 caspase family protein [Sphingomonas sp.]